MSEWQGFDQRKICPKCGNYQTSVGKYKHLTITTAHISITVILFVGMVILMVIMLLLPSSPASSVRLWVLFFTSLTWLGVILFNPQIKKTLNQTDQTFQDFFSRKNQSSSKQSQVPQWIGYRLECQNCGYTWKMTIDEWETEGQREQENLINSPSFSPPAKSNSVESFAKIEWQPPNANRGIFIVISVIAVFFIASSSLFGVLWSLTHLNHSYAPVVSSIGLILGLLAYIGLMVVFKFRVAKIIPVVLLALIAIALWVLLK
jgi:predicted nucleic-acid-binding Zn-ribbon protein